MREPPDYEAYLQGMWRDNAERVLDDLAEERPGIVNKIRSYVWRFGYTAGEVRAKIVSDDMFAKWFAIEPRRQNPYEAIALDWLRDDPNIDDARKLPTSGREAYYVTSDGEIRKGMQDPPGKSVDFYWKTGTTEVFAYHKYTKHGGGDQDNQLGEMRETLRRFQGSRERDKILFVIVDGPYYDQRAMGELRRFVRDREPRSYACHIEDVPEILTHYVNGGHDAEAITT